MGLPHIISNVDTPLAERQVLGPVGALPPKGDVEAATKQMELALFLEVRWLGET